TGTGTAPPAPATLKNSRAEESPKPRRPWWTRPVTWYKTHLTLYSECTRGRVIRTEKGAPAERAHSGTVGRRAGRCRHRPAAGLSPRTSPGQRLHRYRLWRPDRRPRRVRVARRQAAAPRVRLLGRACGSGPRQHGRSPRPVDAATVL